MKEYDNTMLNKDLLKIDQVTGFSKASKYVKEYKENNPKKGVLSLGIGDVSKPIVKPIIDAMHQAVDDLSDMKHFSGYGSYYGLDKLKETILKHEYSSFNFTKDEIFVSDGTKSDSTNLLELFDPKSKILLSEVVYPIYRNGAYALSRKVYTTPLDKDFKMVIPKKHYDIVYICSPNNPIGNAYTYDDLKKWVHYCLKEKAVLIFDNVYECFIRSKDIPRSIYEIKGSEKCAIELRSFSKKASFTGLRCSYFVLPKAIDSKFYKERTINRFNGASYIAQMGAIAYYSKESQKLIQKNLNMYHENIQFLKRSFQDLGFEVYGGEDAPYLWIRIKEKMNSFDYFKKLLNDIQVVVVPGIIFGDKGDSYFRVSGLGTIENSKKAIKRIQTYYEK